MTTSAATAAFARDLADGLGFHFPGAAYEAGLLHQIGRLILLFNVPVAYPDLWYSPTDPSPIPKAPTTAEEKARFGSDYTEIGACVATEWEFPERMVVAIKHHRHPAEVQGRESRHLALIVASARRAATSLYGVRRGGESAYFGLSAPLTKLARSYDRPVRELLDVLAERREEVRAYADEVLKGA